MRAERPAEAARALAFGRVKVCGITNAADATLRGAAGATHAGFVMVPGTPRAVTRGGGRADRRGGAAARAASVGVFRNEKLMQVARCGAAARARRGPAPRRGGCGAIFAALRALLPETIEIWAAGAVGARRAARRAPAPTGPCSTPRSAGARAAPGGRSTGRGCAGRRRAWRRRCSPAASIPAMPAPRRAVGAWALDVGSGVEAAPGRKDSAQARRFLRGAAAGGARGGCVMLMDGRFGAYGGAYVPEILVPALEQLEAAFLDGAGGCGVPGRAGRACSLKYAGRPTPLTLLPQSRRRQGAHLPEARGSAPRRRAQDQPGARPGAAREADGQDAADRRDRRRPARRRHRDGGRAVRARDPHLHGRARMSRGSSSTSSGCG